MEGSKQGGQGEHVFSKYGSSLQVNVCLRHHVYSLAITKPNETRNEPLDLFSPKNWLSKFCSAQIAVQLLHVGHLFMETGFGHLFMETGSGFFGS